MDRTTSFRPVGVERPVQITRSEPVPQRSLSNPVKVELEYKVLKNLLTCEKKVVQMLINIYKTELNIEVNIPIIIELKNSIIQGLEFFQARLLYHSNILKNLYDFEISTLLITPLSQLLSHLLKYEAEVLDINWKIKIQKIKETCIRSFNNFINFYYQIGVSTFILYYYEYNTGFFMHYFDLILPMFSKLESEGVQKELLEDQIEYSIVDNIEQIRNKATSTNQSQFQSQAKSFLDIRQSLNELFKMAPTQEIQDNIKTDLLKILKFWPCKILRPSDEQNRN